MTFKDQQLNSMTFQAWKIKFLNFMTFQVFHDLYEPCKSVVSQKVSHLVSDWVSQQVSQLANG